MTATRIRAAPALLLATVAVAGCVAAAATPDPSGSVPATGGASLVSPGAVSPGDPGSPGSALHTDAPASTGPEATGVLMTPDPVVGDTHAAYVQRISASLAAGRVVARLEWVSGAPPCTVLARVGVVRSGRTFTMTVLEGSTRLDIACIEMAMDKATLVDLGTLPAGTYDLRAEPGDAPGVTVVIP